LPNEAVEGLDFIRRQYRVKGAGNVVLVWRILKTVKGYSRLTVRQLFYILISRFPRDYPATRAFYKRLDRYLGKIRRVNAEVHMKFIDPTRPFAVPPLRFPKIECWVEKDSIKNFIGKLAVKYRLGIQVLRGFASLSMFRRALERARKRRVTHILYIGDFDPSGLLIDKIAEEEMKIKIKRIILTMEQIKRFRPPSRPVNRKDSRAKEYVEEYGDRCWEVEALAPRTLFRLVEEKFRENVPVEFLVEAEERELAARIVRRITERLRMEIEREALILLRRGIPEEEVRKHIAEKYGVRIRRR